MYGLYAAEGGSNGVQVLACLRTEFVVRPSGASLYSMRASQFDYKLPPEANYELELRTMVNLRTSTEGSIATRLEPPCSMR